MNATAKGSYRIQTLFLLSAAMCIALASGCSNPSPQAPVNLTVSAAASLTDVLKGVNILYTQNESNVTVTTNFASSGTLQTQIENGAPVDLFISAAPTQMDNLQ